MKTKTFLDSTFFNERNLLNKSMLALIKGGTANADEYELIYIDGKPYLVKKNSSGQIIEMRPLY